MQPEEQTSKSVLACIDSSEYAEAVCDYAAWISKQLELPLQLFHNIDRPPRTALDMSGAIGLGSQEILMEELTQLEEERSRLLLQKGKLMLNAARDRVMAQGAAEPVTKQRHGPLAASLLEMEDSIRVLVLGIDRDQEAGNNRSLGAQLESTIRALHSPILVVNSAFKVPEQVMLAFDGSQASCKALDMLAQSPLLKGVQVHLVTVGDEGENLEELQNRASEKLLQAGHKVIGAVLQGQPSEALCQYQRDQHIDLTLMGAFSHHKLRDMVLGSMTAKMLLGAQKPLWLLR